MEDISSPLSDNMRKDATRILKNLLGYDPKDEEDLPFIQLF